MVKTSSEFSQSFPFYLNSKFQFLRFFSPPLYVMHLTFSTHALLVISQLSLVTFNLSFSTPPSLSLPVHLHLFFCHFYQCVLLLFFSSLPCVPPSVVLINTPALIDVGRWPTAPGETLLGCPCSPGTLCSSP